MGADRRRFRLAGGVGRRRVFAGRALGDFVCAGAKSADRLPAARPSAADPPTGSTLWQALATPAFWVFGLTISIWGMIYAGVALFNVDIFKERGFDQKLYFNVLALVTIVALAANMFFGWLVNYVGLNRLLTACLLATDRVVMGIALGDTDVARLSLWHRFGNCLGSRCAAFLCHLGETVRDA